MAESEKRHARAKRSPRWKGGDDELARRKKNYYRNKRPDLDPQSTMSRVLETIGLDEPYRNDSGSYDYRRKAWDESLAAGNPDLSWFLPEMRDIDVLQTGAALEPFLGVIPDIAGIPEEGRFQSKRHPFPDAMMGTREREGNKHVGALTHFLDQFNITPYSTGDIVSSFTPDSAETVQRDIDAWKGGSSSVDRFFGSALGVPDETAPTQNPYVDPVEIASTAVLLGLPQAIAGTAKGAKKGVSVGKKVIQRIAGPKPSKLPKPARHPQQLPPNYTEKASAGGSVRGDINRAFARHVPPAGAGGLGPAGALATAGAASTPLIMAIEAERQRNRKRKR